MPHRPYGHVLPEQRPEEDDIQRIEAAPLYLRLPALLIDGLILLYPTLTFSDASIDEAMESGFMAMIALGSLVTIPVTFVPGVALMAILEWLTGKSIGKMVMRVRVTGVEDGRPIGMIRSLGRRAFMVMEAKLFFVPSIILIPFNRGFDGHLGDRLTGAIVVRDGDIDRAFRDT